MKKLQNQLQTVSKTLATLSKQVEKISQQLEKSAAKAPAKKAAPKKTAPKKAAKAAAPAASTVLDQVFDVIRRSRNGATIAKLKDKTGLTARQLSNALYKLSKREKIEAKSRGHYIKRK